MTDAANNVNRTRFKSPKQSPRINNINLLQSLMKDMRLNCKLQDEILQCAESGQGLPYIPKELISPTNSEAVPLEKTLIKLPPRPLQRTKAKIVFTGSYEREWYRPDPSKTRPAKEKERLQNMMAFGKDLDEEVVKRSSNIEDVSDKIKSSDIIDEIIKEIKEREDFLEEMSQLGLKEKYLPEIQTQISLRLKELEKLHKDKDKQSSQEFRT